METARHWKHAGDVDLAFTAALDAAELATDRRAYVDAHRLGMDALELYERCSSEVRDAHDLGHLLRRAGHRADVAGYPHDSVERLDRASQRARGDELPMVRLELARARYVAGDQLGAARAATQALDDLPPDAPLAVRATLTSLTAFRALDPAVPGTPLDATTEGLRMAREAGDAQALILALCAHALTRAAALDPLGAQESLHEAEALTLVDADPRTALRPALWRLLLLSQLGMVRGVAELGREAITRADQLGVASSTGQQLRSCVADALLALGEWDEAATSIEDGLLAGDASLMGAFLLLARAELAVGQGRFTDAEQDLALARDRLAHEHPRWSFVASELAWWRRNVIAAQHHAAKARSLASAISGPGLSYEGPASYALVRSSLAARQSLGEAAARNLVDDVLASLRDGAAHPVTAAWHAMAVAESATDPDGRRAGWEAARTAWRAVDVVPARAYCAWRLAQVHRELGDVRAAVEPLAEAARLAAGLAATPLLVEVRAEVAAGGRPLSDIAAGTVTTPPAPTLDTFGLTRREREYVALLAEGWPNRRIAEHLGVSPRTVGTHVSHILRKLEVETRGGAAAVAHRVGSPGNYVI